MDMLLVAAVILAIGLTVAGILAEVQTRRARRELSEKAARSGIRSDWVDEFDRELMLDPR